MSRPSSTYDGIDDEATRRAARVLSSIEDAMEGLGTVQRNYARNNDDEILEEQCNICFKGPLRISQVIFLDCGHVFHTACLSGWTKCVVCDADIGDETLKTLNSNLSTSISTPDNYGAGDSASNPTGSVSSYLSDESLSSFMQRRCERNSGRNTPTCALCQSDGSETNLISDNCGHFFHEECLQLLRDESRPCPQCNADLAQHEPQQISSPRPGASSSSSPDQHQNVANQPSSSGLSETALHIERALIDAAIGESLREDNAPQEQSLTCPVCMEDFTENTDRIALQCTHVFHASCIRTWMEESAPHSWQTPKCPVCKHDIDEEFQQGIRDHETQSSNRNNDRDNGSGNNNEDVERSNNDRQYALDELVAQAYAAQDAISDEEEESSSSNPAIPRPQGNTSTAQSPDNEAGVENYQECPICFTNCSGSDSLALECSHVFHRECLKKWVEENPSCPVCRNPMNEAFLGAIRDFPVRTVATPPNEESSVQIPQHQPTNASPSITNALQEARNRVDRIRQGRSNNCIIC